MARPVTRSELARIAGVSPAAITKACRKALKEARIGKRVDLDHPAVAAYLQKKGVTPTPARDQAPKKARKSTKARPRSGPAKTRANSARSSSRGAPRDGDISSDEIEGFAHLPLDELVEMFGTATAFKDWLDARKKIADIREKDLKNEETQGRLIDREFVKTHVFGAIEAGNRRLLSDSPKTIARRLYALAKAGSSIEEAEKIVREIISSQLKPVATTAARVLRNG